MKPARYLAGLGGARSTYLLLFETAVALLPPAADDGKEFRLECHKSIRDLAARLELGTPTVREALIQLENYGWIAGRKVPRYLGMRVGQTYALLADLAAETVTGDPTVVSKLVLRLEAPKPEAAQTPAEPDARGPNRAWDGDQDWTWGVADGA